jgi:hypothetical protein
VRVRPATSLAQPRYSHAPMVDLTSGVPVHDGVTAEVEDVFVEDVVTIVEDEVVEEVVRIVDEVDDATEVDEEVVATGIISF